MPSELCPDLKFASCLRIELPPFSLVYFSKSMKLASESETVPSTVELFESFVEILTL